MTFKRKIIFLDIDGVLNSIEQSMSERAFGSKGHAQRFHQIDPIRLGLLKWICDKSGADIVISSTWRKGRSVEWFEGFFESFGWIRPRIIGMTPSGRGFRGDEVNDWLEENTHYSNNCSYVIFDDDSDFHPDQSFIHTNRNTGLTAKHCFRAMDVLGWKDEDEEEHNKDLRKQVEWARKTTMGD